MIFKVNIISEIDLEVAMKRIKQSIYNIYETLSVLFQITPILPLFIFLTTLFKAALPFVNIIFSQLIIDEFLNYEDYRKLTMLAIMSISINVILLLIISILSKFNSELTLKLELNFNKKLNFHEMNLAYGDLESNKVKELQRDIEQTKMRNGGLETIIQDFQIVVRNIFNLILAFFSFMHVFRLDESVKQESFWTKPWPLLVLLLLTILSVAFSFWLQTKQNTKITNLDRQANQANGGAFVYMQLISDYHFGKDIRIYNLKTFLCSNFNKLWTSSIGYELTKKLGREKSIIPCSASICNSILDLFIYLLVIMKAIAGGITVGAVVLYIGSTRIFTQSIMGLVTSIGEMLGHRELLHPYLILLNLPEETLDGQGQPLPTAPYTIAFEHVYFKYANSDINALEDISFTINYGQKTALVGENGSGKTTAIKLLCRIYEPQNGKITLNGIDIKEFNIVQYRRLIGVVFQDFSLTSFKLCENIASSDEYSYEQVLSAIDHAGLSEWLTKQSDLSDTYLFKDYADNGVEISGGEAQKISIARAIYKDAPLLILDEPTAALDPRSEALIYENFNNISLNKTALFISHRLSSCRFCHNIFVFNCGKLVQIGTHEQLVNHSGPYHKLWEAQAQFYISREEV